VILRSGLSQVRVGDRMLPSAGKHRSPNLYSITIKWRFNACHLRKSNKTFIIHTEGGVGRLTESQFNKCSYIGRHVNHRLLVTNVIFEMSKKLQASLQVVSCRISVDNNCAWRFQVQIHSKQLTN
jgi:hypothetical protein